MYANGLPPFLVVLQVTKAILGDREPLTTRPSAALAPADFAGVKLDMESRYGHVLGEVTDELVISSLLYPKVFDDYVKFVEENSSLVTLLPTPVYWYGLEVGDTFPLLLPSPSVVELLRPGNGTKNGQPAPEAAGVAPSSGSAIGGVSVNIGLVRVGPMKSGGMRTVVMSVGGVSQEVEVKDDVGGVDFSGPMADTGNLLHVPSPMPGQVEKLLVAEGEAVVEGQAVIIISAMKMEVQVKAVANAVIASIAVAEGDKVVEGALLATTRSA
ncbi:unnamed protein product [Discosporangium mesarthrocarpum]